MEKKAIKWALLALGVYLIVNLSRNVWRLKKAGGRIEEAERRLRVLEEERRRLLQQKRELESDEFVEKEARGKLFMAKEGEVVVILPKEVEELKGERMGAEGEGEELANWEKWVRLFW